MDDKAIEAAIQRAGEIARLVRTQMLARLAFPWRFEDYPLADLAGRPTDAELEAWIQALDFRYQRAIEGDEEI